METSNKKKSTQESYVTPEFSVIAIEPLVNILDASRGEGTGSDFGDGGLD